MLTHMHSRENVEVIHNYGILFLVKPYTNITNGHIHIDIYCIQIIFITSQKYLKHINKEE